MTQSSYSLTLHSFLSSFSILLSKSLPLNPSKSQNLFGSFRAAATALSTFAVMDLLQTSISMILIFSDTFLTYDSHAVS